METELQLFDGGSVGRIRALVLDGAPWFVAKDICDVLGYKKARNAISTLVDPEDALKQGVLSNGGKQKTTLVNESGLYALIFGSRLESARKFKRWVTSEVLPAIRTTGSYAPARGTALLPGGGDRRAMAALEQRIAALAVAHSRKELEEIRARLEALEARDGTACPTADGVRVVRYSARAVAVVGDTRAMRERLRALGGRWCPFLTVEGRAARGWVFAASREGEILRAVDDMMCND